jgi:MFS superfamily sulfate permease-like transporter
LAYFLAGYLVQVPMACIGGILMWVACNMVKPAEVKQVLAHNWFHIGLMIVTAVTVIITDFLTGVLTGLVAYGLLFKFLDSPGSAAQAVGRGRRTRQRQHARRRAPQPRERRLSAAPCRRDHASLSQLLVACRTPADAGLICYAAMICRLGTPVDTLSPRPAGNFRAVHRARAPGGG